MRSIPNGWNGGVRLVGKGRNKLRLTGSKGTRLHIGTATKPRANPKPLGRRQQRKLGLLPKPIVIPQPDGTHKVIR